MTEPILDPAAVEQVRRAAAVALAAEGATDAQPSPDVDWSAVPSDVLLQAVTVHRVAPLLAARLDDLAPPPEVADGLRRLVRGDAMRALRLAADSRRAVEVLQERGIPVALFKGVALSQLSTGTLAARGAGDIDLLVLPADVPRAHDVLVDAGWQGDPIPDAPRWWAHYLRVRRERSYLGATSAIDLHWRVGWHDRPVPTAEVLLSRTRPVRLGDADVPTLDLADAFALTCYTSTVDRYARLRSLVDVVRLARRPDVALPSDIDWRLRRVVAETVALADTVLGGIPVDRRTRLVPPGSVDTERLLAIWHHSTVRRDWIADDVPLGEIVGIYRDSARFAGIGPALGMALVDGLLPPERIPPGTGAWGTVTAMGREVGDLVRRRVLPGS